MIYLDNAATSYPKPKEVLRKTLAAILAPMGNPGRSGHRLSTEAAERVYEARELLAALFGLQKAENLVFTSGATAALNLAVLGTVQALSRRKPVLEAVCSVFEHNSVLRPLYRMEREGKIRLRILPPDPAGGLPLSLLLSPPPDLLVLTLKSNVTGRSFDLKHLSRILAPYGTVIIADAAQTAGVAGASFAETGAHMICAPGHKGLMGIMGAGVLAVSEQCPVLPEAVFSGGSGTDSFHPEMPSLLPERLEAGTLPLPAVISMAEGARFLMKQDLGAARLREITLKKRLAEGLSATGKYLLYEPDFLGGPLLVNHRRYPSEEAARLLGSKGVMVRGGFHCAPLAHRFLGTEEHGALRLSPGFFTTEGQINRALEILDSL